ncbi:Unknown protein [Striga hermonthica]|uniref:Uncharacterized protein n=1 Tax=Striga hermonthica TaxID=68872 RepID=A0A9N7N947_STRHE|nr:Unknown protein [Striga hermonthica]
MSAADLQLTTTLLPIIKIITIPHTKSDASEEEEEQTGQDLLAAASCCTPKSMMIPAALVCPPAPRKPPPEKRRRWCKRESIVGTDELESFFKGADQRINIRRRLL